MKNRWPEIENDAKSALLCGAVFFLLWLFLRCYNVYPGLFLANGEIRLLGADSYFHLRHAEAIAQDFPHVLRRDPMAAYPSVERGLNQGGYDLTVAGLSKLSFGLISCKLLLMWLSPVLSGLGLCLVGGWLWRALSPWGGLLFWGLSLAYPGPLTSVCAVGNGDHHGYELFLFCLLALSLHYTLQEEVQATRILLPAAVLQMFFLSWAGAPLHLFFTGLCFYAVAFLKHTASAAKRLALKGVLFGLVTSCMPLAMRYLAPDYILWSKSFQVFLAAGFVLVLGYPLLVTLAHKLPTKARVPVALSILASIPFLAQLSPATSEALNLFFSPRSATISEHATVSVVLLLALYGLHFIAVPLAPIVLYRQERLGPNLVPVIYGLGIVAFWVHTRDFNYYAPPVVAASAAYLLMQLPYKKWTPVVPAFLTMLPFLPFPAPISPWIKTPRVRETIVHTNGMDQAAKWLAQYKDTEGKGQDYGLLAPWDWGSALAYLSKTPVGFSQTHSPVLAELFYSTKPNGEYEKLAGPEHPFRFVLIPSRNVQEKFGTELVVAGGNPSALYGPGPQVEYAGRSFQLPSPNQAFQQIFLIRLFNALGKDMGHYRMVYETPQRVVRSLLIHENLKNFEFSSLEVTEQEAEALKPMLRSKNKVHETSRGLLVNPYLSPDVRIFELVPGALLVGKAEPHARVGAILSLSSPYSKSPEVVTWKSYADSDGNFELRVPFPTEGPVHQVPGSIVVNGKYRVDIGGRTQDVSVTEEQVQSEARIPIEI